MQLKDALVTGFTLWEQGKPNEAAHIFDTILQQDPHNATAFYGLGSIALGNNATSTAKTLLERAVQLDPDADWAWHNLGIAHKQQQDIDAARACYERALKLNPDRADTVAMVAGCYVNMGAPKKAIDWADKALKMNPGCPHALNHKALALLELHDWAEGWDCWLKRWEVPERAAMARKYNCPKWDGKPLDGTLVIHGEQGLGDEILFMSCFEDVKKAAGGARIVLESAKKLVPLFRRSFSVPVYGTESEVKAHEKPDAWISMGDLPAMYRRFDKDFERQPRRFLSADPVRVEHWRKTFPEKPIGIAWYGGLAKTHSKLRNAPLELWQNLVGSVDRNFVSVQYETGDTISEARKIGVPHWVEAVADFDDLTAMIEACDMVISVCQTAHHAAGGLGKACWTLVPSRPAWRYGLRGDNIWYPSVRQFRQKGDDWDGVFARVRAAL